MSPLGSWQHHFASPEITWTWSVIIGHCSQRERAESHHLLSLCVCLFTDSLKTLKWPSEGSALRQRLQDNPQESELRSSMILRLYLSIFILFAVLPLSAPDSCALYTHQLVVVEVVLGRQHPGQQAACNEMKYGHRTACSFSTVTGACLRWR